jgi:uncharacterized protein (TIGR02646 family)
MRKFSRAGEPEFLAGKWESWGTEFEENRARSPGYQFHWHQLGGEPVNHKLLPLLKAQTQDHCSFCDAYPVAPPGVETIEHFRPKSAFPRDAYKWANLYFCCPHCQGKGEQFDESLLQPDEIDYEFDRYFRWDFTQGTIEVNELALPEDQHRARVTIDLYKFNVGHPSFRRRELKKRGQGQNDPIDDFAYRHFIEPVAPAPPAPAP